VTTAAGRTAVESGAVAGVRGWPPPGSGAVAVCDATADPFAVADAADVICRLSTRKASMRRQLVVAMGTV
jgi:hypothetical protein